MSKSLLLNGEAMNASLTGMLAAEQFLADSLTYKKSFSVILKAF